MTNYESTKTNTASGGKKPRARYLEYNPEERNILREKLLGDNWEDLGFLNDFWNIVHDERDLEQYRRMARSWQLQAKGLIYKEIGKQLSIDTGKACAYVRGLNCRPNLAQMYLNHARLGRPREAWKWILDSTPKPTSPYPRVLEAPDQIRSYDDIPGFLKQFPPVQAESEALKFFNLTSEWADNNRTKVFGHLLGFTVGDAGKNYPEYETRGRRTNKTTFNTIMSTNPSNYRVLRYTQLSLEALGISSVEGGSKYEVIRWRSVSSNLGTWMIRVCLGLNSGEHTSTHPLRMDWLKTAPKDFIIAFLQGLADSDGYVRKDGRYCEIASVPNAKFYEELIHIIGHEAKAYPLHDKPRMTRMNIHTAAAIPLFNPIIQSYRFKELSKHIQ